MRTFFRRGIVVGMLGAMTVLGAGSSAFAAVAPTTSPEAIGLEANGTLVNVASTPDATLTTPGPLNVVSASVAGVLAATALTATVTANTATASVASLGVGGLVGTLLGTLSAGAISSSCTANSDGTFTQTSSIANLNLLGGTFNGTPGPNTTLTLGTLPLGITTASVTLNEQVAGPVTGSHTVNAIHISLGLPLGITEDIYIASSTCGPFAAGSPLASGKGLGMGLGLLAVGGLAVGVVRVRRHRLLNMEI